MLRSTGEDGAWEAELLDDFDADADSVAAGFSAFAGLSEAEDFSGVSAFSDVFELFVLLFDTVTSGEILSTVPDGRPAFDRSPTEEYGRPSMIFFA